MICHPGLQRAGNRARLIELEQNIRLEQQLRSSRGHALDYINGRQTRPRQIAAGCNFGCCLRGFAGLQRQGGQRSLGIVGLELQLGIQPLGLNTRLRIVRSRCQQALHHLTRNNPVAQIQGAERGGIQLRDLLGLRQSRKAARARQSGPLPPHLCPGIRNHARPRGHHHVLQRGRGFSSPLAGWNA